MSGWPSGLRRCVQVAVWFSRRGFESHFWHTIFLLRIFRSPKFAEMFEDLFRIYNASHAREKKVVKAKTASFLLTAMFTPVFLSLWQDFINFKMLFTKYTKTFFELVHVYKLYVRYMHQYPVHQLQIINRRFQEYEKRTETGKEASDLQFQLRKEFSN